MGQAEINEFVEVSCVVCGNFWSDKSVDSRKKFYYERFFESTRAEELELEQGKTQNSGVWEKEGLTCCLFINLVVHTYSFPLRDGTVPKRDRAIRQNKAVRSLKRQLHPYGDADLIGFPEWWEATCGQDHQEQGQTDMDELLDRGQTEFRGGVQIERLVRMRNTNVERWQHCVRENLETADFADRDNAILREIADTHDKVLTARESRLMATHNRF